MKPEIKNNEQQEANEIEFTEEHITRGALQSDQ